MTGEWQMKYDVIIIGAGPAGLFSAYELISKNPKLFMGFSDVTVLLNNLYKSNQFFLYISVIHYMYYFIFIFF